MKVYVVLSSIRDHYSDYPSTDYRIEGVFTTKEKAEECRTKEYKRGVADEIDIEEEELIK